MAGASCAWRSRLDGPRGHSLPWLTTRAQSSAPWSPTTRTSKSCFTACSRNREPTSRLRRSGTSSRARSTALLPSLAWPAGLTHPECLADRPPVAGDDVPPQAVLGPLRSGDDHLLHVLLRAVPDVLGRNTGDGW